VVVIVSRCNNTIDPTCANDSYYAAVENAFSTFRLNVPFINTLINPGDQDYRSYYLDDSNGFVFTSKLGSTAEGSISSDIIETDVSVMPWEDIQKEDIVRIPQKLASQSYIPNSGQPFIQLVLKKSPETTTFSRSFNKIDSYFSYVGGLIGTIIGFMFIMEKYNEKAFEISIGHKLFKDNDNKEIPSSSFHVGSFCLIILKSVLDLFKCKPEWKKTQTYMETC
jgi:hypothetical protein